MTGLIENSHFLNDLPDPEEAQCVLSFTLKTKEKNLNLKTLVDQGISAYLVEEVDKRQISDATHVVVGIVYGAEAYCVLAQDLDTTNGEDEEARNEAEENLSKIANKFEDALSKNLSVANFKETLDKKENHLFATSLKCRLYSDLLSQPILQCNLFDIYKYILVEFRGQMNEIPSNKMKSVPIAVQLCPLKYISGQSRTEIVLNKNFHDVDDSLISSCSKILASLKRVRGTLRNNRRRNRLLRVHPMHLSTQRSTPRSHEGFYREGAVISNSVRGRFGLGKNHQQSRESLALQVFSTRAMAGFERSRPGSDGHDGECSRKRNRLLERYNSTGKPEICSSPGHPANARKDRYDACRHDILYKKCGLI